MKTISLILVTFLAIGCSDSYFNSASYVGKGKVQSALVNELENANIKYRINDKGEIEYNSKYENTVNSLTIKLLKEKEQQKEKRYGFHFAKDLDPKAFYTYLDSKGINTDTLILSLSDNAIYWKKEEDQEMQENLMEFLKQYSDWHSKHNAL